MSFWEVAAMAVLGAGGTTAMCMSVGWLINRYSHPPRPPRPEQIPRHIRDEIEQNERWWDGAFAQLEQDNGFRVDKKPASNIDWLKKRMQEDGVYSVGGFLIRPEVFEREEERKWDVA